MLNSGDTAWVLIATALVMLMTPAGLALFYGGLANKKSVVNTIGMSVVAFCVATLAWIFAGYHIAFGNISDIIDKPLLSGIGVNDMIGGIPHLLFIAFQGVFAAIAVAIISGSVVERMKFSTWIIFSALWVLFVYSPLVRLVWGGGLPIEMGELDFAGGTVIHINAGIAGLLLAILLGKRKKSKQNSVEKPSSTKLTVLGAALLWFGWFGFNAGSQLAADGIAVNALLVTNIAACAGGMAWLAVEWNSKKKPSILGIASGAISGLVGITPAAGYVDVSGALIIGLVSGLVGYYGVVKLKALFNYDDTLDAFGIHGLVGIWGSLATGIFANPAINGEAGFIYGNPAQLWSQVIVIAITIIVSLAGSYILYQISRLLTRGARLDERIELKGVDKIFHGETSFAE